MGFRLIVIEILYSMSATCYTYVFLAFLAKKSAISKNGHFDIRSKICDRIDTFVGSLPLS